MDPTIRKGMEGGGGGVVKMQKKKKKKKYTRENCPEKNYCILFVLPNYFLRKKIGKEILQIK